MANPLCLVFEPDATGHHLHYVRHLVEALLEIGCRVTLVLQSDARDRAEFKVHVQRLEPDIEIDFRLDPRQKNGLKAKLGRVRELVESMARLRPDRVYVPYADQITQAATVYGLLHGSAEFSTPIEVLMMRGKYGYPLPSTRERLSAAANRWLTLRNPWHVTHMLDPWALQGLRLPDSTDRFRLIPEPVEYNPPRERQSARRDLAIPENGRYVAMIGLLEPRKGIEELLAAFSAANLAQDDRVLLVGRMAAPIRDLLHSKYVDLMRQRRIIVIDRYVTDDELSSSLFAADVIAVTHPRQIGSSGALVRAAATERYLLTSNYGWIGWATDTFRLGRSVDVTDADAMRSALQVALDRGGDYTRTEAATRFCQYHTVANQQAHWVRSICTELCLPLGDLSSRIEWQWVMDAVA